jgi:hypothetical protein
MRRQSPAVARFAEKREREQQPSDEEVEARAAEERRERQNADVVYKLELLDTLKRIALAMEVSAGLTQKPTEKKG